jgi:hypothetical protein
MIRVCGGRGFRMSCCQVQGSQDTEWLVHTAETEMTGTDELWGVLRCVVWGGGSKGSSLLAA